MIVDGFMTATSVKDMGKQPRLSAWGQLPEPAQKTAPRLSDSLGPDEPDRGRWMLLLLILHNIVQAQL